MTIVISLALALLIAWFGGGFIKKHRNALYIAAIIVSGAVATGIISGVYSEIPAFIQEWIWPLFSKGALATAIFIVVMYIGTLKNGSMPMKKLMPIRAELSIIASILTLAHNIGYGRTYFVKLFISPGQLPVSQLIAAICSLVLIAIMLPLFITSFPVVRKKMNPRSWKRLQRWAYLFYGLIYVHVMLINVPLWQKGNTASMANIIIYSIIFFGYAAMRLRKALLRKHPNLAKPAVAVCGIVLIAVCTALCIPWSQPPAAIEPAEENTDSETAKYADGSYFGTGKGFNGDITLAVRIQDGLISGVTVVSHSEDSSYFDKALALTDSIIAAQSVDIDAVSGATYSSNGLKEAIANALESATITE